MKPSNSDHVAKRFVVRGRVQGVGFRAFVERVAKGLGVRGWVRNRGDGSVEVYGIGLLEQLSELEGYLWKGPYPSEVRHIDETEAAVEKWSDFQVRY